MTDSEETLYTGYVYMIYNDVNDKVYIGETLQKITTRFKQHIQKAFDENRKYDGHLFRAIRKYGKEHFFVKEIDKVTGLDRNKVKEEIQRLEVFYISKYDSQNNGYNLTSGGEVDKLLSVEAREKISQSKKSNPKNAEISRAHIKLATEANIVDVCMYEFNSGKLLGVYHGAYLIAEKFNIDESVIIAHCKGKSKWARLKNNEQTKVTFRYKEDKYVPKYTVECFTDDFEIHERYIMASDAAKIYGINRSQIYSCCKGQRLKAGTYNNKPLRWRYIKNDK